MTFESAVCYKLGLSIKFLYRFYGIFHSCFSYKNTHFTAFYSNLLLDYYK